MSNPQGHGRRNKLHSERTCASAAAAESAAPGSPSVGGTSAMPLCCPCPSRTPVCAPSSRSSAELFVRAWCMVPQSVFVHVHYMLFGGRASGTAATRRSSTPTGLGGLRAQVADALDASIQDDERWSDKTRSQEEANRIHAITVSGVMHEPRRTRPVACAQRGWRCVGQKMSCARLLATMTLSHSLRPTAGISSIFLTRQLTRTRKMTT